MRKLLGSIVAALALATPAVAEELRASTADAEALVKNAIAYLKRHGPEKAFKEFQNRNGPFMYRDLYVIVYDPSGRCIVHGADPSRNGKDFIAAKDKDGKLFIQERMDVANKKGSGWHEYKWANPANGKVEPKIAYVEKFQNYVLSSGAYKP
jgi:cytochrome c